MFDAFIDFTSDLYKEQQGAQTGAPYRMIGLIRESNSVDKALKESLDRRTTRFSPKRLALTLF